MLHGVVRVERAHAEDLEQLLAIAAERRTAYAAYQSQFWRPAAEAVDRQRAYFNACLDDDDTCVLKAVEASARLHGFGIGLLVPAPPVYDPGGPSCVVDDLAVADAEEWPTLGPLLLDGLRDWAVRRGAAQIIVVTAHLDEPKRSALQGHGLTLASEWWVGPVDQARPRPTPR